MTVIWILFQVLLWGIQGTRTSLTWVKQTREVRWRRKNNRENGPRFHSVCCCCSRSLTCERTGGSKQTKQRMRRREGQWGQNSLGIAKDFTIYILYYCLSLCLSECLKVFMEMTKLWKFRMRLHDIFGSRWTTHTRLSIDWEHVSQSTWPRYETLERTLTYLVPVATAQFAYPFDTTYMYVYMHNFWVLHKHQR